jgi:hypothetical protein
MSTAFVMNNGDSGVSGRVPAGVVSVHVLGFANAVPACSCGWAGRRRYLKAAAEQDAWAHAIRDRCSVSSPLLIGW